MCELFGISSQSSVDVRGYLEEFYSHSRQHPHGWGLMRESNGKIEIIKECVCASQSAILNNIIAETEPQTNLLAHIRLATIGSVKHDNCHPYTGVDNSGRHWTLIHNGTIYSGTHLSKYLFSQTGDTDSERILLYLLDEMNNVIEKNEAALSVEQRCSVIDNIAIALSPRNKLNLMIYDGEILYVHTNMKDTLMYKTIEQGIVISTQSLDDDKWEHFPMTQLCAFNNGTKIFEGTNHGNEFIPTLEYITALDAMNI
ncbi:MAG: class II glutamine amidotransferase [Oscillospiraceae bacterium]|nr:class II glutamine amidotransferase [Oscillospiraceae bacterium]